MKQEKINYQDLKDLGFEEGSMDCSTHQNQHGYDDFWVRFKLSKRFEINWEHNTRVAELQRMEKGRENGGNIEERIPIKDINEVRKYLYTFGHLTKEEYYKLTGNFADFANAC